MNCRPRRSSFEPLILASSRCHQGSEGGPELCGARKRAQHTRLLMTWTLWRAPTSALCIIVRSALLRLCGAPRNRKQADTLAALVQEVLAADPYSGAVYVFRAKRIHRAIGARLR
jgi:hypothetical protein